MKDFKYEDIKHNDFVIGRKLTISLTDEYSHEAKIELGQGSFNIGVKEIDDNYIDVWVDKDDKIHWESFNKCEIFNQEKLKENEYSKWPRFFYYSGNDTGFVEWSQKREIEDFTWKPQKEMKVDFTKSHIYQLYIHSDYKLNLSFGKYIKYLDLYGDLNNFIIENCLAVPSLGLYPKKDLKLKNYSLPNYECFHDAEELLVEVDPNGAPFDCKSLLQFPNLKLLHLNGNMTNLSVLKELKHLNKLGFWNVPELSELPSLDNWKELNKFVAMNIDENTGKRLKEELKELKKKKKFEFVSISKLRNKLWFETEYGLPFSNWDSLKEKKAISIYKKCLKEIKSSTSENDVKNAIIKFTNSFNKIEGIETIERDDIYSGLCTLMKNSPISIEHNIWLKWFDEERNF